MNAMLPNQPIFFIGTSGWTYDHWKGCFYPHSLPQKRWFEYYATHFTAVEVNATFYRTFKNETYRKWKEQAPQGFRYVLKTPKLITHRKCLVDVDEDIKAFYRSCSLLEDKFGMILLQVAPNMPYDVERLQRALHAFPDPSRVAVEFRRPEWFAEETISLLREVGATICNVDSPQQKLTNWLIADRVYLRLHGRTHWYSHNYSPEEIKEIAILARQLVDKGATRVYIFFNNDFEGYAPTNAMALRELLSGS